jgi:hypothetical protein
MAPLEGGGVSSSVLYISIGVGGGEVGSRTRTIGAIGVDEVWPARRYAGANAEVHWKCSFRGPYCLR